MTAHWAPPVRGGRHEPVAYPRGPDGIHLLDALLDLRDKAGESPVSRTHIVRLAIDNLAALLRDDETWADFALQWFEPRPCGTRMVVFLSPEERRDLGVVAQFLRCDLGRASLIAVRLLHFAYAETT